MESKIIEHLENIKIFTEYKKSGLSNLKEFWERIDAGKSVENLQDNILKFRPIDDYDPTEQELKESLEKRERQERIDQTELYLRSINERIENALVKDSADLPVLFRIEELQDLIRDNTNLELYLATSENILKEYIQFSKDTKVETFFVQYQLQETNAYLTSSKDDTFLDKYLEIPQDHRSDIFAYKGFRFFALLIDHFPKSNSDWAYIYWKLKLDKYIHSTISDSDFNRFLDSIGVVTGRLKPLNNISSNSRDPLYKLLHKLLKL